MVQGRPAQLRFFISKLSAVQVTITRDGRRALEKVVTFRRGNGSFAWTPKAPGAYSLRLAAKKLRTGRGLRSQVIGQIQSLPG